MLTLAERFWAKVDRRGPDECWPWLASRDQHGYGQISIGNGKKRLIKAHRAAWIVSVGGLSEGACVLHRCDNPQCVNVAHLFLGTMKDNSVDMAVKGRWNNGKKKLTVADVTEIRRRRASGEPLSPIARDFGIGNTGVSMIALRRTWKHVP